MILKILFLGAMYFVCGSIIVVSIVNVAPFVPTNREIAILVLFWPIPTIIILVTIVIGFCVLFVKKFAGNSKLNNKKGSG